MAVLILYKTAQGSHEQLEWIADSNWTVDRIIECFRQRYPTAEIISCLQLQQLPCSV